MSNARNNIIARLRSNRELQNAAPTEYLPDHSWDIEQRIQRLSERMRAVHTEVIRLPRGNWIDWLNTELPKRSLKRVVVGCTEEGLRFAGQAGDSLQVHCYDNRIEEWKERLFNEIDVGITTTLGGIAESGSLILWPNPREPRLMSLVPPVHIALLDSGAIHETFAQAMEKQRWSERMPTNALLISGPSKTADIEQTLAYGIHGPKELIVLVLE